ncbi:MAG: B12-binding domain-containing radical SAM protein [Clostridiales bacterium]|jgi:radical SAM superfamily enzyme YgiQ (UPF0313 family)|nr:B12-binding domain-containing radical SAM protein [Clostridiales bacterium]
MKILLVALDAKFIHTNLAVHSLKSFSDKYKEYIHIAQYSINHTKEEILRGIYLEKADLVAFSCYIWNMGMIGSIIESLRKVQPQVKIWFGGPEVSYNPMDCLVKYKELDGIVIGEGEETFYELIEYYLGLGKEIEDIYGIAFKDSARRQTLSGSDDVAIEQTPARGFISLDDIPFAYPDIESQRNKIIYYESSRGCPYSCSYCLSSAHRGVRYRRMDLVKTELKVFLDQKVPQIKFVDRTFNCNKEHAMEIWRFIRAYDNGVTNFHFEITADLLSDEELDILQSLRPGLLQLEIGVQTTNPDTMKAIRRKVDFDKLSDNVRRIKEGHNVHQHLDLIAGLPLEDYSSFEKSFNDVYELKPDQLQLGFLKVLKGSMIEEECEDYGIVYNNDPPYEVLYTSHLSYGEIIELKGICDMVEVYYNSGQFAYSIEYMVHYFDSPMRLYASLYQYYDKKGLYTLAHSRMRRYEILLEFFEEMHIDNNSESGDVFKEILLFDICLREALRNRPNYVGSPIPYKSYRLICDKHRVDRSRIHLEKFAYDVIESARQGKAIKKDCIIMFDYDKRDPISNSAEIKILKDE